MSARQAAELSAEIDEAAEKAWESLARYKFVMFGYWAGIWVHLNRIEGRRRPNPFAELVSLARARRNAPPTTHHSAPLLDREAA